MKDKIDDDALVAMALLLGAQFHTFASESDFAITHEGDWAPNCVYPTKAEAARAFLELQGALPRSRRRHYHELERRPA